MTFLDDRESRRKSRKSTRRQKEISFTEVDIEPSDNQISAQSGQENQTGEITGWF